MRSFAVLTTTNKRIFDDYCLENIKFFVKYWPKEIKLHVFLEDFVAENPDPNRVVYYDLHKTIPSLYSLKLRNKNLKIDPTDEKLKNIKSKPHKDKTYIFDYVRFANKSYVIFYGIENIDVDYIIWLDADVRTHTEIPLSFLEKICPEDSMVSYLRRDNNYTETGFLAFNRRHPKINNYLQIAKDIYENDKIYSIDYFKSGYTDCHVFDYTLNKIVTTFGTKVFNLNERGEKSHPFINSQLGLYMDHFKGERRKKNKRSDPTEVRNKEISSKSTYWQPNNKKAEEISRSPSKPVDERKTVENKKIIDKRIDLHKERLRKIEKLKKLGLKR